MNGRNDGHIALLKYKHSRGEQQWAALHRTTRSSRKLDQKWNPTLAVSALGVT
jgi:hypothetical protein